MSYGHDRMHHIQGMHSGPVLSSVEEAFGEET
jgi:hypothetical protein